MSFKIRSIILLVVLSGLVAFDSVVATNAPAEGAFSPPPLVNAESYNLPPLASPQLYGNILIDRTSSLNGVRQVSFSHWLHRRKYTCKVCHSELEFAMKVNTTEITEAENRSGRYCGACHNGRIAFRSYGNCVKCHNGDRNYSTSKFFEFETKPYPRTVSGLGNGINWVESLRRGMVQPETYLKRKTQDNVSFARTFVFPSESNVFVSPAIFPHKAHVEWLDCGNCHPALFNIKHKGTKDISMSEIAKGNFCGVCHLNVAFPLDDCNGCHPRDKGLKQ